MGTGYGDGGEIGIIPQVMETIFKKIESLKHQAEFQIRVSFVEILKEEVHDLLDPNSPSATGPSGVEMSQSKSTIHSAKPLRH
jgi:hypothetical protein